MGFYPVGLVGGAALANPVTVAQGGTGAVTAAAGLAALGGAPLADAASWVPSDVNYIAWAYDPAMAVTTTSALANASVVYLIRVNVRAAASVTNVEIYIGTAGSLLTAAENYAGLYNSAGTLIGTTADQTANWGTAGYYTTALIGGPYAIPAGFYWVAMVFNGTTGPAPLRQGSISSGFENSGLAVASARYATNGTGNATLPASITPGSNSLAQITYWAGIS
jgi:hypothetical protein